MSAISKWIDAQVQHRAAAAADAATKQALDEFGKAASAWLKSQEKMNWNTWLRKSWFGGVLAAAATGVAPLVIAKMSDWVTLLHGNKALWAIPAGGILGFVIAAAQNWLKHRKPVPM